MSVIHSAIYTDIAGDRRIFAKKHIVQAPYTYTTGGNVTQEIMEDYFPYLILSCVTINETLRVHI